MMKKLFEESDTDNSQSIDFHEFAQMSHAMIDYTTDREDRRLQRKQVLDLFRRITDLEGEEEDSLVDAGFFAHCCHLSSIYTAEDVNFEKLKQQVAESMETLLASPEQEGEEESKTRIVCGWAGIGKSYLAQAPDFRALDLDSAKYSWIKDAEGNNTKERNPNANIDYPAAIINEFRSQKHDLLLVSTHDYVREALRKEKIPYMIVHPSLDRKDEFKQRYIDRKNDEAMIKLLIDGWDTLLGELKADTNPLATHLEMAESGSFLDAYAQQLR